MSLAPYIQSPHSRKQSSRSRSRPSAAGESPAGNRGESLTASLAVLLAALLAVLLLAALPPAGAAPGGPDDAEARLLEQARQWVSRQVGAPPDAVRFAALDARVRVPACERLEFDFPFASQETVRARCLAPAWQVFLRAGIVEPGNIVFAARTLPEGHRLGFEDMRVSRSADARPGVLRDPAGALGRPLRRQVARGEPILEQDLDETASAIRLLAPLRAGERLAEGGYRIEALPASRLPAAAFTDTAAAADMRVRRDLPAGHLLSEDDVLVERQAVIARQDLRPGTPLSPGMVGVARLDRQRVPPDALRSAEAVAFAELNRSVRAGEVLRASDLRPAILVRRGGRVTLRLSRGALELTIKVEALHDARMGESVRLVNPASGKVFSGIVTGQAEARLE